MHATPRSLTVRVATVVAGGLLSLAAACGGGGDGRPEAPQTDRGREDPTLTEEEKLDRGNSPAGVDADGNPKGEGAGRGD